MAAAVVMMAAGAANGAPVEAYGQLPSIEDVRIAPGGQKLASTGAVGNVRVISIVGLGPSPDPVVLKAGDAKLRSLDWIDDNHLLFTVTITAGQPLGWHGPRQEFMQGFVYDLAKHKLNKLMPPLGLEAILAVPSIRSVGSHQKVFFQNAAYTNVGGVAVLNEYDVDTGFIVQSGSGSPNQEQLILGPAGERSVMSYYGNGVWWAKIKIGNTLHDLGAVAAPVDRPFIAGLGPKGDTVVVGGVPDGPGKFGWGQISLATAAWLPADEAIQGDELLIDPRSGLSIGMAVTTDRTSFHFFDPGMQASWTAIQKAFPGEQVEYVSASQDRKKVVVKVFGPKTGNCYLLIDLASGHADLIGEAYAGVPAADVAQVQYISYPAADGLGLQAYLTLPNGRTPRNLPMVVLVHGGPDLRDSWQFDWIAQAFAAQGYAVLQPQYRGSHGFGELFREKGFGEWGRKMQTDLSDGVRYLAGKGIIDPKRACIVGGSYGGYAALAGMTLENGVYRCAVAISAVSDLKPMLDWQRTQQRNADPTLRYFERYMGAEGTRDPSLNQISPLRAADKASGPILLIHGDDDTVVPIQQSQIMLDALRQAAKPVQFVTLKHEDHWLSRGETRLQMLQETVKFVQTNNPPDPAAQAPSVKP